jgi:GNAT superfamily N-acetyltransferase
VIIRPGAPSDLPAVGRLGALLVRLHHELDPARFIPAGPETERAYASYLGTQLDKPRVVVLVAERGGEVIGYTYAGVESHDYMALRGPAGVLYDIVVDPAYRGNGIGRRLLDATLAALKGPGRSSSRAVDSRRERGGAAPVRCRGVSTDHERDDAGTGRRGVLSAAKLRHLCEQKAAKFSIQTSKPQQRVTRSRVNARKSFILKTDET